MALQQTNHLCEDLLIAIKLLRNNEFKPCLIHINFYLEKNLTNSIAYDIKGTCHLKLNQFQEALKAFQIAIQADPNNLGIVNNTAYILIELGRYEEALSMLKSLQAQWHHPSVYQNLSKVQKLLNNEELCLEATQKVQNSRILYPKIQVFQNRLIFNFLLDFNTTMARAKALQIQLNERVHYIHKQPISTSKFKTLLTQLKRMIEQLRNLQFKFGIIRPAILNLCSYLLQSYIKVMSRLWLDIDNKIEKQIYAHYHQEINQISNKAEHVFWKFYLDVKQQNLSQTNLKMKNNFNQQFAPLVQNSLDVFQLIQRDKTFLKEQNGSNKYKPVRHNFLNYRIKKDLVQFEEAYQKNKTNHEYCISFQKGQSDPCFIIVKPAVSQSLDMKDLNQKQPSKIQKQSQLLVYLNIRKCTQRFDMTSQCRNIINKLQDKQTINKLTHFYWAVTFLAKIYTWYREGSLQVSQTTQKTTSKYYLSISQLIQIISPILDQIPKDSVEGIGQIVQSLHQSLVVFLIQCRNGEGDPLRSTIIQNISRCLSRDQNQISNTLTQAVTNPQMLLLITNLQKSFKSDYLKWRIQLILPKNLQNQESSSLLVNLLSLLINFGYLQGDQQNKDVLMVTLVNTFITTTNDSGRVKVINQFYQKHHKISLFQKGLKWLKWIFI